MAKNYPAVLYILEPVDEGFDKGRRFRIDQVDGDQAFFTDRTEACLWCEIHGIQLITEEELNKLREQEA